MSDEPAPQLNQTYFQELWDLCEQHGIWPEGFQSGNCDFEYGPGYNIAMSVRYDANRNVWRPACG